MEVYKRPGGSPFWYIDFVHPVTGERIRQSLKVKGSKAEANKAAQALLEGLNAEAKEAKDGKPAVTIEAAVMAYIEHLKERDKASAGEQEKLANKLLGRLKVQRGRWSIDGSRWLHSLTRLDMVALGDARRAEGNGPQTIAHELKLLRAATRHAAGRGFRVNVDMVNGSTNDAWAMPELTEKTRYLTLDEFRKVHAYLDPNRPIPAQRANTRAYEVNFKPGTKPWLGRRDAQDLLVALAMCGGRWSEVASLCWDRIDTEALEAWGSWRECAVGTAQRPVVTMTVWGNKTKRERLLGCPDLICEVLWRRWRERDEAQPLVFPTTRGTQHTVSSRAILQAMNDCGLNDEAKVREAGRATVHSLRHTFASFLLQRGAKLPEIQDALGHTSLAMTRRYAHLERRESAHKLSTMLSEGVSL